MTSRPVRRISAEITEKLEEAFADNEEWLARSGRGCLPVPEEDRPQDDPEGSQASGRPCNHRDPSAWPQRLTCFREYTVPPCSPADRPRSSTSVPWLRCPRHRSLDGLDENETSKRYMHHYNFPSFSVGETKPSPEDRDAVRSVMALWQSVRLLPVLPSEEEFPYAIRTVSETMESNGSTSQASICASTHVPDGSRCAD